MTPEEIQQAIDAAEAEKATAITERDKRIADREMLVGCQETYNGQIADAEAAIAAAQAKLDQAQAKLDEVTAEIPTVDADIAAKVDEIAALEAEIERLKKELEDMAQGPVGISMGNWSVRDDAQRRSDILAMKNTGFTWIRHGINWSGSEKPAGTIQTWTAQAVGKAMKDHGMKWLVVLAYSPLFYSVRSDTDKAPPKPEHYDEWQKWCEIQMKAVSDAMGGDTKTFAFEIWNEQNHVAFWYWPDPAVYVKLLKRARAAANKVNPNIQIVFGGMAPAPDRAGNVSTGVRPSYRSSTFVRKCYEAGMTGADFNAMNFHPYNGQQTLAATAGKPWDMNTTIYNEVVAEMTKHGDGAKKMWSTEFGYGTTGEKAISEAQQGPLLVDQIKYLRSKPTAGVTFVFNWIVMERDGQFGGYGLVKPDRTPKPAVAVIRKYLTGA